MNERDELVSIVGDGHFKPPTHVTSGPCCMRPEAIEQVADAILAAGYRKPRTITTAEELDALEAGSVILCEGDRTGESVDTQALTLAPAKTPATGFHWRNHWITYFGNGVLDDFETVTVLWEPR